MSQDAAERAVVAPPDAEKLSVIIKADVVGSQEALVGSMPADVNVIASSVGDVSDSDVLLAQTTGARILGFGIKVTKSLNHIGCWILLFNISYLSLCFSLVRFSIISLPGFPSCFKTHIVLSFISGRLSFKLSASIL